VASRYDRISLAALRALRTVAEAAERHKTSFSLCGEMAGRPLEAMALIGIGYRALSMTPSSVGPVKTMILGLDGADLRRFMADLLERGDRNPRDALQAYAQRHSIEI
jgi:phosphotransferase system enzyme I (PtsP)